MTTSPPCETAHQPTLDQPTHPPATTRARWRDVVDDHVMAEALLCDECVRILGRSFARQSRPLVRTEGDPPR